MNKKVVKNDLIIAMSLKNSCTKKESKQALSFIFNWILKEVIIHKAVNLVNFGKFQIKCRKEKQVFHPKTKKKIMLPQRKALVLKFSKNFFEKSNV